MHLYSINGLSAVNTNSSDPKGLINFTLLRTREDKGEGNGNPLQCLAWRIPGTGKPGGLPSMGSHRIGHD